MSDLVESNTYIWSQSQSCYLGNGATARVFQGVDKTNGAAVAVKCFYPDVPEKYLADLKILRRVKHENIVKFLAVEDELQRKTKVVAMELCLGGSLMNNLRDPEHCHGLQELEFLNLLDHLSAGMRYLRCNNLIHRDLKPDNIMKCIREDGTTVYKLTDFGTARHLADNQFYQSVGYGTEEYLRPDVYERLFLRPGIQRDFDATVDLWSIGVTLYQTATGSLPFIAFGGRRDRGMMHWITSSKKSGVLSGVQYEKDGPVKWSRELPSSCRLSDGLKKIVTPLLAGLLESDLSKIWSYDTFFKRVDAVLSRKAMDVFYVDEARLVKIYVSPEQTYQYLQSHIEEQTHVDGVNQILLLGTSLFSSLVQETTWACDYPKTTEQDPVFLINNKNLRFSAMPLVDFPTWASFSPLEPDAAQAKTACTIGYECKHEIEKFSLRCKLLADTVENYTKFINNELIQLDQSSAQALEKALAVKNAAQTLKLSQEANKYTNKTSASDKLGNVVEEVVKIAEEIAKLKSDRTLKQQWSRMLEDNKLNTSCPFKTLAPAKANTYVNNLKKFWQHLIKNPLTHQLGKQAQMYQLKRTAIKNTLHSIKTLLTEEVFPHYQQLDRQFKGWHKQAQEVHLEVNTLAVDVEEYTKILRDLEKELAVGNESFCEHLRSKVQKKKMAKNEIRALLKNYSKNNTEFQEQGVLLENEKLMKLREDFNEYLHKRQKRRISKEFIALLDNHSRDSEEFEEVLLENQKQMQRWKS